MKIGAVRLRGLADSDATEALGARLARHLPRPEGAAPLVLHLSGELGAGKTTFVRGLLRALGVTAPVRSPSYTLMEQYPLAGGTALHIDLYRLQGEAEFEQLGSRDYFLPGSLWLVEWPERAPRGLPAADLNLEFVIQADRHLARIAATSPTGGAWLAAALPDVS